MPIRFAPKATTHSGHGRARRAARRNLGRQPDSAGLAWHYKEYQREQLPKDRAAYAEAEVNARRDRVGLWRDSNAIPPWEYRR